MKSILNYILNRLPKTLLPLFIACMGCITATYAGSHKLESGRVSITLPSPVGQLEAVNHDFSGTINTQTGALQIDVTVNGFQFITESTPEHINKTTTKRFREYYLETGKFPTASFNGKVTDLNSVNFSKNGSYTTAVRGLITMHGVTKEISGEVLFTVTGQQVYLKGAIDLELSAFNIRVPEMLKSVFFKTVHVGLEGVFKP